MKKYLISTIILFAFIFSSCSTVVDEFQKQNYGRVYNQRKLENEFKNGQCIRAFESAERWFEIRNREKSHTNLDHNILAWLYVTCPNPSQRNPDKALQLMKTAAQIAPLKPNQFDTLACAYALKGDFKQAIQIVQTHKVTDKNPGSNDSRQVQFSKKILCEWDGQMPPYEPIVSEEHKQLSENLRKTYLDSIVSARNHIQKKPADVNAAIEACEANDEQGNLHFCKSELAKMISKIFELQAITNCKPYDNNQVKAKRCYEFYFSYVTGRPYKQACSSEVCLNYLCSIHVDVCK